MPARRYAIVEAPSVLGLTARGVDESPGRLLELGLAQRLGARVAARLAPPTPTGERDAGTGVLNSDAIAAFSPRLADAVGAVLDAGDFPVVLGGDCSIVLGSMLGLRRRGRHGLLFVDGNADFFQPDAEPRGEAASMDLALVTGHGPAALTNLEGRGPLVRSEDAVAFGFRDHADQAEFGSQPLPPELKALDLPAVRRLGVEAAAREAMDHLAGRALDGVFIHLDVDVLDDAVMPAVDYRIAGGFSWDELRRTLRIALASELVCGLEVAIYNPRLDPDGAAGRGLVETLAAALA